MPTQEKALKTKSSPANKPKSASKQDQQEVPAVAQHNANMLENINKDILDNEAAHDTATDELESQIIAAHMKLLDEKDISLQDKQEILEKVYARIDKRHARDDANKKENTKRLKWILWAVTAQVVGVAILKYAPDIINACMGKRRV